MLPVALVIPLHGYFMIICVFFKICIVHTALPLLCLTATRKISFVLSFAIFFRRVFEVSNINKNHEVLRLNLSTFQPVSPKLNDKERSSISFCSIGLMFEIKSNRVCLLCQSRADRREILVGRDLIRQAAPHNECIQHLCVTDVEQQAKFSCLLKQLSSPSIGLCQGISVHSSNYTSLFMYLIIFQLHMGTLQMCRQIEKT